MNRLAIHNSMTRIAKQFDIISGHMQMVKYNKFIIVSRCSKFFNSIYIRIGEGE